MFHAYSGSLHVSRNICTLERQSYKRATNSTHATRVARHPRKQTANVSTLTTQYAIHASRNNTPFFKLV